MTPIQRQQKGRLGKMNRTDVKGERTLKLKLSSGKLSIPLPPSLLFLLKRSSKPSSKPTKIRRKRKNTHTLQKQQAQDLKQKPSTETERTT